MPSSLAGGAHTDGRTDSQKPTKLANKSKYSMAIVDPPPGEMGQVDIRGARAKGDEFRLTRYEHRGLMMGR